MTTIRSFNTRNTWTENYTKMMDFRPIGRQWVTVQSLPFLLDGKVIKSNSFKRKREKKEKEKKKKKIKILDDQE